MLSTSLNFFSPLLHLPHHQTHHTLLDYQFIFHKELEGFFTANGYAVHPWSLLKQTVVPSPFYFFVNFTFMHQLIYQFFVFRFCYIDFEKRPNYFVVLRELFKRTGEVRLNKIFSSKWSLINNYGVHRITQTNKANP